MKKILLLIFCLFLGFLSQPVHAEDFDAAAQHAIAVDAKSGKILYEKNATTSVEVASISKLITAYLVYEAIEDGKITLKTPVDISDYPYELTLNPDISNIPMEARRYTVGELLEAMLISSSNSAAIALAEKLAGSETQFVDVMRQKVESWGITDAKLVNASGLNNEHLDDHIYPKSDKDDENKLSAYDVAIIARNLITDYPEILKITQKPTSTFGGIPIQNSNYMLENMISFRSGVDGLKTGSSEKAGESFVATTVQNGMRIITVVLKATETEENPYVRFTTTSQLMSYIFRNFSAVTLVYKHDTYEDSSIAVMNGKKAHIPAVAQEDLTIIKQNGSQHSPEIHFKPDAKSIKAPIKKGQKLGTLTYSDSELIGQGYLGQQEPSVTMVAEKSIDRPFFLIAWWHDFVAFVNEKL
ncbi:D-alanyl-D-alanine carboxypeptidase PBP3 [Streptococcus himalayensis]|uniref:serine-type D-Ala-D-Ala carboxypeptidase n=1 Tax=Streptococcus himalayensis TaxID=1888195 RepID=A0A917A8L0_9STRE|nr:D-alanyl-D-alanine carboxypeptidase PBP3 [Streptococcus himalayensis]GGE30971.1 D-alanyl-D-alanine carboxypeptidase [Streptococcus himalayensis]